MDDIGIESNRIQNRDVAILAHLLSPATSLPADVKWQAKVKGHTLSLLCIGMLHTIAMAAAAISAIEVCPMMLEASGAAPRSLPCAVTAP